MEKWQREHIVHNLPYLVESTLCNGLLLATLRSENILSVEDVQEIQDKGTTMKKSSYLFEMLPHRKQSYEALISALHSTCQSGSVEILVAGFILNGSIHFQRTVSLIFELVRNLDEALKQELISLQISQPSINDVVVKNTVPSKPDYYIPRTIVMHRKLYKSLFQENCPDVFLIHGLEWNELSLLAGEYPTDVSTNILDLQEQIHTRFVLMESLDHFDIIVDKTKEPVHLIQYNKGAYQWIKSRGAIETILKFVDPTPDMMNEDSFVEQILNDHISVCLTDSPGMGKTVLLANLATEIGDRYPLRLVVFVFLREFIPVLQAKLINGTQLNNKLIQTLLSEYVSDHPVGRRIVLHKLINEHSHLCLDGFDEVFPEQRQLANTMLELIENSFPKCQMLVTARLHMHQELEQTIGTLGFHIAPFNIDNQIEFLTKFWKCRGAESGALTEYAKMCLTNLAASTDEEETCIAGIPLQCYMIGEVFLGRAKSYTPGSVLGTEVPIRSMAQLYDTLIHTKLDTVQIENVKESVTQAHIHLTMELLFPEEVTNFSKYPKDISNEQLCRVGIMEHAADGSNGGLRFVHRTFAEFFAALFALTLLQNLGKSLPRFAWRSKFVVAKLSKRLSKVLAKKRLQKEGPKDDALAFVLRKVLATYESRGFTIDNPLGRDYTSVGSKRLYRHPVISYFLNFHLQLQEIDFKSNIHYEFGPYEHFDSLLAIVSHDCLQLFTLFVSLFDKCKFQASSFSEDMWYELQKAAAKYSDVAMLENIFEFYKKQCLDKLSKEKLSESEAQFRATFLMYVASFAGNYKIVEYLVRSKRINLYCTNSVPHVLHFCMWYTSFQPEAVINRKVQIIKYLAQRVTSVLNNKWLGLTPILGEFIHLDLIKCAIECGSSIHDRDKDLKSVLHLTPEYMTPEVYHNLICFVLKFSDKKMLTERDAFECTPLHYAMQYLPILLDTFELFLTQEIDINFKDLEGNSILFYAVRYLSGNTLDLLAKHGAKLDDTNLDKETALHIAYKYSNSSGVKWLIEHGADETAQDASGNIPSAVNGSEFTNKVRRRNIFVPNKGNIHGNIVSESVLCFHSGTNVISIEETNGNKFQNKTTALHVEFCQPLVDIDKVKLQFRLNADFNARNADGDTPLHLGVINAEISREVLDFAVKVGGADLNLDNNCGLSVLAQAIQANKNVSFLQLLVEYGADVNRFSNFKAAIGWCNLPNVKFLLEHGADVVKVSREGQGGKNPITHAFRYYDAAHYEVVKCLITSTPQLNFDDSKCITEIVFSALEAYKKCDKFRTAELFNLMASHGLNFTHCDKSFGNIPAFFYVIRNLDLEHVYSFVIHLVHVGYTNLGKLKFYQSQNLVQYFIANRKVDFPIKVLKLLGDVKKILNSSDDNGCSVLVYTIHYGLSVEYMKQLIEVGANINHLDKTQASLLHYAVWYGDLNCVEFFVDQVVDKNCVDVYGRSALHWAFLKEAQNYENAKHLISKGVLGNLDSCSVKIIDVALSAYRRWGNFKSVEIFLLMISHGVDIECKYHSGLPILFEMMRVLSAEHCEEVLTYLFNKNKIQCFHLIGKDGETLLRICMQNFEPSAELLNLFKLVEIK